MEERGLLNDAETMLCVAVVVKQYLQHAVSTGAREHALLAEITHSLGLVSILALNAVRVINAVSFDYLLL